MTDKHIDAEPESNLIAELQATIDRLTSQRYRLLETVKAQRQREIELLHVMRNIPHDHYYVNKAGELIAEIEAKNGNI